MERTHRHYVLICDDSPAIRSMLVLALRAFGYDCQEASNGRDALQALSERPICVVLLDMRMPLMDGATVLRELASSHIERQPPIVAISGGDQLLLLAAELGAAAVLAKPFSLVELRVVVDCLTAHEPIEPALPAHVGTPRGRWSLGSSRLRVAR